METRPDFAPTPITLSGRIVRLEPLTRAHFDALYEAGRPEELWRWTANRIQNQAEMRDYLETALLWQGQGTAVPFVTIAQSTGAVIGSTRFANIDWANRRLEIGWTWVTPSWQRSGANCEAKLLMLRHAFEELGAIRVEFKTDSLNEKSRGALKGIGATEEGTLRNHMIVWNGRLRHSVYYSVIVDEWPRVGALLEQRLRR